MVDSSFIGMTCIFRVDKISCAVATQIKRVCRSSSPLCLRIIFLTGPLGTEELEAIRVCVCVCVGGEGEGKRMGGGGGGSNLKVHT